MDHKPERGTPAYAGMPPARGRPVAGAAFRIRSGHTAPAISTIFVGHSSGTPDEPAPRQPIANRWRGIHARFVRHRGLAADPRRFSCAPRWAPAPRRRRRRRSAPRPRRRRPPPPRPRASSEGRLRPRHPRGHRRARHHHRGHRLLDHRVDALGDRPAALPEGDAAVDQRHHRRPDEGPQHHLGQRGDGRGHRHHRAALRQRADQLLLARLPDRRLPVSTACRFRATAPGSSATTTPTWCSTTTSRSCAAPPA